MHNFPSGTAIYYCCESDDENSDLEIERNGNTPQPLYPGASITVEDSILSIMKYALRHKLSYSALSDLLSLITLHIPSESRFTGRFGKIVIIHNSFF